MTTPDKRLVTEAKLNSELGKDTGWRDLSAELINGWTGKAVARRSRQHVQLMFNLNGSAATGTSFIRLPAMFAPSYPSSWSVGHRFLLDPALSGDHPTLGEVTWAGIDGVTISMEELPRTTSVIGMTMYLTTQAWNTVYPGVGM